MLRRRLALPLLCLLACQFGCHEAPRRRGAPIDADHQPAATTWKQVMRHLDSADEELVQLLLETPRSSIDKGMARVTQLAEQGAAGLRRGYGEFEDRAVPDFARLARDAESWLLQVAMEARQGHAEIAVDLFRSGRERHCTACHDASERVHG